MSTASVPLPNWINYALIPLINLVLAHDSDTLGQVCVACG